MLLIWTGRWNKKCGRHTLPNSSLRELNKRLKQISLSYPEEFHRVFTNLDYITKIKAVELRALLLYTGPALLKSK